MNTTGRTPRLDQLTSLRFFAAFAVLFYHTAFIFSLANEPWHSLALTIFDQGYSGVTFFFILSGFILSHTYQDALVSGRVTAKKYILLRMARIFPLHWVMAAILILHPFNTDARPSEVILNLMLLQSWSPDIHYIFSLNGVSWTLSAELFFYCAFVYLVRFSTRTITVLFSVWTFVIYACAALFLMIHGTSLDNTSIAYWFFIISPATRLLEFVVGVLIYRFVSNCSDGARARSEGISILLLGIAAVVYSAHKPYEVLRYQLAYLPFMAFVIYSFAQGDGIISRILRSRILVLLGDASFSLYMIHQVIIHFAYKLYSSTGSRLPLPVLAILLIAFCTGMSIIVYKFIELPIHQYLKRKISTLCQPATVMSIS